MPGRLGIPATIVMPEATPFNKVKHTRDFGADVMLRRRDPVGSRCRGARASRETQGLTFIHPYDDPQVIAGQGTVGAGNAGRCARSSMRWWCRWAAAA